MSTLDIKTGAILIKENSPYAGLYLIYIFSFKNTAYLYITSVFSPATTEENLASLGSIMSPLILSLSDQFDITINKIISDVRLDSHKYSVFNVHIQETNDSFLETKEPNVDSVIDKLKNCIDDYRFLKYVYLK